MKYIMLDAFFRFCAIFVFLSIIIYYAEGRPKSLLPGTVSDVLDTSACATFMLTLAKVVESESNK